MAPPLQPVPSLAPLRPDVAGEEKEVKEVSRAAKSAPRYS